jgi:hypothetical protein
MGVESIPKPQDSVMSVVEDYSSYLLAVVVRFRRSSTRRRISHRRPQIQGPRAEFLSAVTPVRIKVLPIRISYFTPISISISP